MSSHNIWTVEEGGSVDLNCSVSNNSSSHVDIEWYFTNNENNTSLIAMQYKKEQTIMGKKERIRFLGKDFDFVRLQIADLQVQDSGKYTAKIKTVVDKEAYFKNCSYNLLVKQSRDHPDGEMHLAVGLSLGLLLVLVLVLLLFIVVRCYRYKYLFSTSIRIEPTSTTMTNTTILRRPSRQPSHYRPGAPFPQPPSPPPPPPTDDTCSPPAAEHPTDTLTPPSEHPCLITRPPNPPPQHAKPFRHTATPEPPVSEDPDQDWERQEGSEYINILTSQS